MNKLSAKMKHLSWLANQKRLVKATKGARQCAWCKVACLTSEDWWEFEEGGDKITICRFCFDEEGGKEMEKEMRGEVNKSG